MSDHPNTRFIIRNLRYNDIPELASLPRTEGREMGQETEILSWMNIDPYGIYIAVNVEDVQIAGCCSGIALSDLHGYIGMYVVKDIYRGIGLGRMLWQAAVSHLGNRNLSLSSAPKMIPFYQEKAGFTVSASWTVDLYETTQLVIPENINSRSLPFTIVVEPESTFIQNVLDYDLSIHRYDRSSIVQETIKEVGTVTVMSVKLSLEGLETTGYACIKKSLQGHWLIAPVYAEDYSSALSLIYSLLSSLSDKQRSQGVVTKLISTNFDAAEVFCLFGLRKTNYQLQRLFTKKVFEIPETKIFALQTSVFCTE